MNEKITLPDLINIFSEKQGISKKDAELFVRAMFDLIEETLATEKYVKVKGLGTFKLTEVDSRESVNVNTGERIEIQGHTKVSFTPDTSMKDLINKPFAHFETVVLNDGVELEDTPTEEVVIDAPETMEEAPVMVTETPVVTEEAPIVIEEKPVVVEETPVVVEEPAVKEEISLEQVEEVVTTEETTEQVTPEQPIVEPVVEEPTIAEEPITESIPEEKPIMAEAEPMATETKQEKKEKNINRILLGIIVVLILIILFGAYWMFIRPNMSQEVVPNAPIPVVEEVAVQDTTTQIIEPAISELIAYQELSAEELKKERIPSLADTLECTIVGTQTTYTLQKGETIIKASIKFFSVLVPAYLLMLKHFFLLKN